jgi:hypothetical protein
MASVSFHFISFVPLVMSSGSKPEGKAKRLSRGLLLLHRRLTRLQLPRKLPQLRIPLVQPPGLPMPRKALPRNPLSREVLLPRKLEPRELARNSRNSMTKAVKTFIFQAIL